MNIITKKSSTIFICYTCMVCCIWEAECVSYVHMEQWGLLTHSGTSLLLLVDMGSKVHCDILMSTYDFHISRSCHKVFHKDGNFHHNTENYNVKEINYGLGLYAFQHLSIN